MSGFNARSRCCTASKALRVRVGCTGLQAPALHVPCTCRLSASQPMGHSCMVEACLCRLTSQLKESRKGRSPPPMLTKRFSISVERSHSQSSCPWSARPDWLWKVLHFHALAHCWNATKREGTPSPSPPPRKSRSDERLLALVSSAFMACPIGCRKLGTDQTLSSWHTLNWPGSGRCGHAPVSKKETSERYWYRVLLSPRKTMLRPRKAPSAAAALTSAPLRE